VPHSFLFPARTPLPTEQERYLDMLLMVREAMGIATSWYASVYFDARGGVGGVLCEDAGQKGKMAGEAAVSLVSQIKFVCSGDDKSAKKIGDPLCTLVHAVWAWYTEDKATVDAGSGAAAAMYD